MKTMQFSDMCAVWNGAVQTEFKVICSDFASRFKRHRNKAELFVLLSQNWDGKEVFILMDLNFLIILQVK